MRNEINTRALGLAGTLGVALAIGCGGSGPRPYSRPAPNEVSVGYSTTSRTDVVSAISSLEVDEARDVGYSRIEDMLEGRVPGLRVLRSAHGGATLQIRGVGSFTSEPLLVIDGVQMHPGNIGSALAALHVRDVARVDVLKDASSAAIYGIRGGNGVIIITTRRRQ